MPRGLLFACIVAGATGCLANASIAGAAGTRQPAAAVFDWSGFYVGGSLGGLWGDGDWTATSLRDPPGIPRRAGIALPIDASSPANYDPASFRAGLLAGYNWRLSPQWIGGLEADVAWGNGSANRAGFPGCSLGPCTSPGSGFNAPVDFTSVTLRWSGSARLRAGYLVNPNTLVYGTGGVAWQNVALTGICGPLIQSDYCNGIAPLVPSAITTTQTFVGWTLGGGVEWRLAGNWLARGEYRFADFGSHNEVFGFGFSPAAGDNTYRYRLSLFTHTALFGLAYKFGGLAVP